MNLAVISVGALALAVVVSCVSPLNVGVLAVALAWIVGVYIGGLSVNVVMGGFPSQLFLTLTGVTLLYLALAGTDRFAPRKPDDGDERPEAPRVQVSSAPQASSQQPRDRGRECRQPADSESEL